MNESKKYYPNPLTLYEARKLFFFDNSFPEDGGYQDSTVLLYFGFIKFHVPNIQARKLAVPYHDAHHIITSYEASTISGEAELAAWELGSGGCRRYWEAWLVNFWAIMIGLFICPIRTYRAYLKGRQTKNLYEIPFNWDLLSLQLGVIRENLGFNANLRASSLTDYLLFFMYQCIACITGLLLVLFLIFFIIPLNLFSLNKKRSI